MKWVSEHPGTCPSEIAEGLGIKATALSNRLRRLEKAGLVVRSSQGRKVSCYVPTGELDLTGRLGPLHATGLFRPTIPPIKPVATKSGPWPVEVPLPKAALSAPPPRAWQSGTGWRRGDPAAVVVHR